MARTKKVSVLARVQSEGVEMLAPALAKLGRTLPVIVPNVKVTELAHLKADLLVVDLDGLDVDPLETLRMLRFVLSSCMIAVYTDVLLEKWALDCHTSGANCLLSKASDRTHLALGLRRGLRTGCFTDPSFSVLRPA
jgi:DNA-binding NarL/FixJ family response regulator